MKSVYIFGPIHLYGEDYLPVYKHLAKLAGKYFEKVICTYPDFWETKETPRQFYDRTYETIINCNLFIAEVTSPSTGVGMELQMGQDHNIPIIALCKSESSPSKMVFGIPCVQEIIYYKDLSDLSSKLKGVLQGLKTD